MTTPELVRRGAMLLATVFASAANADLDDISNFRSYSAEFASSGQPSKRQLRDVAGAGYERVVYLAFTTSVTALDEEDEIVKDLGMDYVQIAVDWDNPQSSDFYAFAGIMESGPPKKTLLHCQVNFRASVFSFLYRVIYGGIAVADAKEDLNSVWQPNQTWIDLIFEVMHENGMSPECEVCDWSAGEH